MAKDCKHKGDCCGYSCELYALDKNKRIERSLKRPFGRSFAQACSCCKSCCYDRRCLARVSNIQNKGEMLSVVFWARVDPIMDLLEMIS